MFFRYSRWDGSQSLDLDADALLGAMTDDLLAGDDPWSALRRLLQRGLPAPDGRAPGLQDLLDRLRRQRQQRLDRFDLGSLVRDLEQKLEDVIRTEREGIERRLAEGRAAVERSEASAAAQRGLERVARLRREQLERLPPDPSGRLRDLQRYDFMDDQARRKFEDLLRSLQQHMLEPVLAGMRQSLETMTAQDLARTRQMLQDLNRMLREKADGGEPDFAAFKQKWGELFPGVDSLDDLLERIGRQLAQMQSLLESMSPEQRRELEEMMRQTMLRDERLEAALSQLAMHLEDLLPLDRMRRSYDFRGDEDVTLQQAMEVMQELQRLDRLERELRGVREPADLDRIDREEMAQALGPEAARDLERLQELIKKLQEAGYLETRGGELSLTARALRKIADKALGDIFAHLKRDRLGRHAVSRRGAGGDRTDEAKRYEFGDPFLLDLNRTVMNAVQRQGARTPVRLAPADFEVYRTELSTRASTVVMLDMSRSMINNGCFVPAKKVALALHALIRGRFPRDSLHIVGFSLYAREFTAADIPRLTWSDWNVGTNMHAGFLLSRQLLARARAANKQIIMITDGEPTAHLEGAEADFAYPPSRRTITETLREVQRCTREGSTINPVMLEQHPALTAFVEQMTQINRGRTFYATPDRLGEYVLVDYVRSKRRRIS
jgi:uncharacterized protein with von Willebrand factor type A (vWA) domain